MRQLSSAAPHSGLKRASRYRPAFSTAIRLRKLLWSVAYYCLFLPSPRPFHLWRKYVLRAFGAKIGKKVHIYPAARIWGPWNLTCEDGAAIADEAVIYNPSPFHMGSHSIVSQQAYICGATHDYEDQDFPLISFPMSLGADSWICARATVQPGVLVGEGAILALGSVATRNLEPWTVYGGIPAKRIKQRTMRSDGNRQGEQ
jgi:putative colanic acid biosynthesis acetyltransferase WcaF